MKTPEEKRLYNTWYGIKRRIYDKKRKEYKWYGGRGICLSKEWYCFENFKNDVLEEFYEHVKKHGLRDTFIERKNNNGNYCKENCTFKTMKEQCKNRRTNRYITFRGETKMIIEWERGLGLSKGQLQGRIDYLKWSLERALTEPKNNGQIYYNGKKQSLRKWGIELGINRNTLNNRLHRCKWSVEKAFTTPVNYRIKNTR